MDEDNPEMPARKPRREKKPPKKITADYLHNSGLYYLQRFPASTGHFRTVMMRKVDKSCRHHTTQNREDCAALVDALVAKFVDMGLLNDEGYSRGMVTSLRRRGLSGRAIQAKLSAKGLKRDQIEQALAEHADDRPSGEVDLIAALRLARRKKLGPFSTKDPATGEKDLATLARAGFGYDIASRVIRMDIESAEELLL
jgi:regulatory protein